MTLSPPYPPDLLRIARKVVWYSLTDWPFKCVLDSDVMIKTGCRLLRDGSDDGSDVVAEEQAPAAKAKLRNEPETLVTASNTIGYKPCKRYF